MSEIDKRYVDNLQQRLMEERDAICIFCPATDNLQFAHVKPTKLSGMGRGKRHRLLDVKNNPKCYELMCKGCHEAFDRANAECKGQGQVAEEVEVNTVMVM